MEDQLEDVLKKTLEKATVAEEKVKEALELIFQYGSIDGDHHKQWVLDQIVRQLTGDKYDEWVEKHNAGEDGPNTYEWNVGIAP